MSESGWIFIGIVILIAFCVTMVRIFGTHDGIRLSAKFILMAALFCCADIAVHLLANDMSGAGMVLASIAIFVGFFIFAAYAFLRHADAKLGGPQYILTCELACLIVFAVLSVWQAAMA